MSRNNVGCGGEGNWPIIWLYGVIGVTEIDLLWSYPHAVLLNIINPKLRASHQRFRLHLESLEDCYANPSAIRFELDNIADAKLNAFCNCLDPTQLFWTLNDSIVLLADEATMLTQESPLPVDATETEKLHFLILRAHQMSLILNGNSFTSLPLILDTVASGGLSPFKANFVDYQPSNITLETAAHSNTVKGVGTLMWKFQTSKGKVVYLPQVGYEMPTSSVWLFSPQSFL